MKQIEKLVGISHIDFKQESNLTLSFMTYIHGLFVKYHATYKNNHASFMTIKSMHAIAIHHDSNIL